MSASLADAYSGRRVLVTGHTGFKGSWLCAWLVRLGARVTGLSLAPDTDPSHWSLLQLAMVESHVTDLRDAAGVAKVVAASAPEVIFHLAAQPLVRRSYREPGDTFATNVTGLVNLYEAVRRIDAPCALVNATTDKVYRPPSPAGGHQEDDPLGGHDPYSTSKACAELVSECWRASYFRARGIGLATARAGNVIGGGDWAEDRLVPDFVRAACRGEALRLRHPDAIRPWQHVLEPLSGYLLLGAALLRGEPVDEAWNFGPEPSGDLTVGALAKRIGEAWPGTRIDIDPGPHPHEAPTLRLDSSKATDRLGWRPVWDVEATVTRTIDWYRAWHGAGRLLTEEDIDAFESSARQRGLRWAA